MIKKYSFLMLASMLVLGACGTTVPTGDTEPVDNMPEATEEMTTTDEVIKIGYIGPLTGNLAGFGQDTKNALEVYFQQNPTINGKQVEVIYEDGKCNGQDAANAAQKLVTVDQVQVIIGGLCSGETLAAAPIAESNGVVLISYASSSPEVTTAGDYIFRNYPSGEQDAKTMVDYVALNHQSLALLTEQTDYSQGYRESIKGQLESMGKKDLLVFDETFAPDTTDFRTQLEKIKESGASGVMLIPQSPVTGGFAVKQAREIGLSASFYSGDTIVGPDFISTAQDAAEGTLAFLAAEDPKRQGYDDVTALLDETQGSLVIQLFAYDAANIIANAITEAGNSGSAIKDYLNQMGEFKGVASDVNFDENGDNNVSASMKEVINGEFVLVTE